MFEVKQKVWCAIFGVGEVIEFLSEGTDFPVAVSFGRAVPVYYTADGKCQSYATQTLFPYPVEIVKKETKPSINWEHVRDEYKFLSKDIDGDYWLFEEKPIKTAGGWKYIHSDYTSAEGFISLIPGNCDWWDSLVKRPD